MNYNTVNIFEPYDIALRARADEYAEAWRVAKEAEKVAEEARDLYERADEYERRAWETVRETHAALIGEAIDRTPF